MKLIDMIILLCILVIIALASFNIGYYYGDKNLEGFWSKDTFMFNGDWIHVRVDGVPFQRALEVCRHEIGHEIYAEYCERSDENFNECSSLMEGGYGKT